MANTLKFGNGQWAVKNGSALAFNDENDNFKPLPFTFVRDTGATRVNKQGLIEVVPNNEPRIDFLNDSKGALLLEPSRSNLIINSEDFTGSEWVLFGFASGDAPILTSNYDTSPDGKQNATRLQFNLNGGTTTTDRSYIRYNSFASQTDYYYSCYVKSANGQEQKLLWQHGGDDNEFTVTNEWQRVELDRNGNAETFTGFSLRGGISTVDTADVLVWGFQVERGSYATSYIPTQGSIGTRDAETSVQTPPDGIIGQNEGVLYAEIKANETSNASGRRTISLSDGTNSNRVYISFDDEYNKLNIFIIVGGTTVTVSNVDISNQNTYNKVAVRYNSGDSAIYVNGVLKNSFNDTFSSGVFNTLKFQNRGSGEFFNGNCKDLRVYNQALTDQELINLTTI